MGFYADIICLYNLICGYKAYFEVVSSKSHVLHFLAVFNWSDKLAKFLASISSRWQHTKEEFCSTYRDFANATKGGIGWDSSQCTASLLNRGTFKYTKMGLRSLYKSAK